jgi:N6-adenosine-specific RNA methylase IME4
MMLEQPTMTLRTDSRIRDLIPPLSEDERDRLKASIEIDGIRDAIVTWNPPGGLSCILDGHNRYAIAKELERETGRPVGYLIEPLNFHTIEEAQRWVINNQLGRRNLSDFGKGLLGLKLLEVEREAARRRQRTSTGGASPQLREIVPEAEKGRARDLAASAVGMSGRTLDKVAFIEEHADEETKARLAAGATTISKEHTRIRAEQRKAEALAAVESKPEPLPDGPFDVIVADPPWKFERQDNATHRGSVDYPPMELEEILAMPVADLAADDAILWMWTTNAHLLDGSALAVVEAWGFVPKTMVTWGKSNGSSTGHWLMNSTEHCIFATRGRPVHTPTGQTTFFQAPRTREHSRKPEKIFEIIESLCPGSKVELFAREAREGWHAWGAEKGKFDENDS